MKGRKVKQHDHSPSQPVNTYKGKPPRRIVITIQYLIKIQITYYTYTQNIDIITTAIADFVLKSFYDHTLLGFTHPQGISSSTTHAYWMP